MGSDLKAMPDTAQPTVGSIVSLWRYPVKSMMGEELNRAEVTRGGLAGDRQYALIDSSSRKVASAKNPKKWPTLFDFRAALAHPGAGSAHHAPVRITLPDGEIIDSEQGDVHQILSNAVKREVTLQRAGILGQTEPHAATAESYRPDMEDLEHRDAVTDFALPEGTFFDCASVHLLTTNTLDRLRELYPQGRFEVRRFRPNIVVNNGGATSFLENAWVGRILALGDTVRIRIDRPCVRCVMTTLAQGDLPNDLGILRTAAKHNSAQVGVYASVLQGGNIRRGDSVRLE
jgi:hypothetical protein